MKVILCAINAKYIHTNLAVRSLRAFCGEADIVEYTIGDPIEKIYLRLLEENAAVYGFSCYLWNIEIVKKLCELLKKSRPGCRIIVGGPEVSYEEDEILTWGTVDHIVLGEGEQAFDKLLACLREGKQAPGKMSCEPLDMNSLPFPYEGEQFDGRIIYYEASRGCPFHCRYCLSAGDKLRFRDIEMVKRELAFFVSKRIKQVKFVDRTFNADKDYARALFAYIISLGGKTNFHCEIAGHLLDEETMALLKTAPYGMFQFEIGVQTTNPDTLAQVRRQTDIAVLRDRVKQLKAYGNIHIHLDLIAGLPGEDLVSFKKSFNDTYEMEPDMLQLGFLKLLKGSGLREDAKKSGITYASFAPYEVISTRSLSAEDLLLLKKCEKGLEFYNAGRYPFALRYAASQVLPFDFYTALGERLYKAKGALNQKEQMLALYRCGLDANFSPDIWKEIIRYDYLRHEKQGEYLEEIGFVQNTAALKRLQSLRKAGEPKNRQLHVEHFTFDVPSFVSKDQSHQDRDVYVLFDYRLKKADRLSS
ncbi:MAG: B12-binding domain-containing radical SAM protein [Christensenellales bacterium]